MLFRKLSNDPSVAGPYKSTILPVPVSRNNLSIMIGETFALVPFLIKLNKYYNQKPEKVLINKI